MKVNTSNRAMKTLQNNSILTRLVILFVAIWFYSCEAWLPCLDGSGAVVTEERLGGSFNGIQVDGEFKVIVEFGPTTSVKVTTDENLQQYIKTIVKDQKLVISNEHDGCINFSNQTQIVVSCPALNYISLNSTGNIEVNGFTSEYFNVVHSASGNITIRNLSVANTLDVSLIGSGNIWLGGRSEYANINLSGSGVINAESMRVNSCSINHSGSGNIHTYVYDTLDVILSGSGFVYYYGNPDTVNTSITGSGQVIDQTYSAQNQ